MIILGAHINPALSISLMTIRKLEPLRCIFYVIGQILGAFLGAAIVYLAYLKQFDEFDGGIRQMTGPSGTADIFFTMPGNDLPNWNALVDQIVGTAILMIFVMAVTHVRE
jgi:glycerol uptake facilitator-like aquaporin